MAIKCGTFGIQGDLSAFIASVGGEVGVAFNDNPKDTRGYKSRGLGWGTSAGAGGGIEFGMWTCKPKDLEGDSYIIALGGSYYLGVEIQVIFNTKWKFLGFQITLPNVGMEVEASFTLGKTKTF